ncbi:mesocentin-like [Varroa jacobsoni]|uniref:mesocentin-like n=1 Tax=Varroa jacobsoni TaxID=62625 RepID=UPI000BF687A0|nr:mesocentin-like [Varroa jacobsoni]
MQWISHVTLVYPILVNTIILPLKCVEAHEQLAWFATQGNELHTKLVRSASDDGRLTPPELHLAKPLLSSESERSVQLPSVRRVRCRKRPTTTTTLPPDNCEDTLEPTEQLGRLVYRTPEGTSIAIYSNGTLRGPDSRPYKGKVDAYGVPIPLGKNVMVFDGHNNPLPTDGFNRPLGPDGLPEPLPVDNKGLPIGPNGKPLPRDKQNRTLGPDGTPLPVDPDGRVLPPPGKPVEVPYLLSKAFGEDRTFLYPNGTKVPVDAKGRAVTPEGTPLPTDTYGVPLGHNNEPLVIADWKGNPLPIYLLPNGTKALKDTFGRAIAPNGIPLPMNSFGVPFGPDGKLLRAADPKGNLLPTDEHGRPFDRTFLLPNGTKVPLDSKGRALGVDGTLLPTNPYGVPYGPDKKLLTIADSMGNPLLTFLLPDGTKVPMDAKGRAVSPDGTQLPTNAYGIPFGPDYQLLPIANSKGYPLPTDEFGRPLDENDLPLPVPIDQDGVHIGPNGRPLPTDPYGKPTGPNGKALPADYQNRHLGPLYPVGKPLQGIPRDDKGRVLGPDGKPVKYIDAKDKPIKMDKYGTLIHRDGAPVPTDSYGSPLGKDGKPLRMIDQTEKPVPTDWYGRPLAPNATSYPIPKDEHGRPIQPNGLPFPTDKKGRFLGPNGKPLPKNKNEQIVPPLGRPIAGRPLKGLPRDSDGKVLGPNGEPLTYLGRDGRLLDRGPGGRFLDWRGAPMPTDAYGTPLDPDGRPLKPVDSRGNLLPVDILGRPLKPNGEPLPVPKDKLNNFIAPNGIPFETNKEGYPLMPDGVRFPISPTVEVPIPVVADSPMPGYGVDSVGRLLGPDGKPLSYLKANGIKVPMSDAGHPLFDDGRRRKINAYGIPLGPDDKPLRAANLEGQPLPIDAFGRPLDPNGIPFPLPIDPIGRPIGPDGRPLSVDKSGKYLDLDNKPLPRDPQGRVLGPRGPCSCPLGPDLKPLRYIDPDGQLAPVDERGRALNAKGFPLPTDAFGTPIGFDKKRFRPASSYGQPLPSDAFGRPLHNGKPLPLPIDAKGKPIGPDGATLLTDSAGRPLGPNGQPLHHDQRGWHLAPLARKMVAPDGKPLKYVEPSGTALPDNWEGVRLKPGHQPVLTDFYGSPLGPDKRPLPPLDSEGKAVPTDVFGRPLGPSGEPLPLPVDNLGQPIGPDGKPFLTDKKGRPLLSNGEPLPVDNHGHPVAPKSSQPVGPDGSLATYLQEDDKPLKADAFGRILDPDGKPLKVNAFGVPLNHDGKPLTPFDSKKRPIKTDLYGRPLGPHGDPKPLPLDAFRRPIGPYGEALPADENGNPTDYNGDPLSKDARGQFVAPLGIPGPPIKLKLKKLPQNILAGRSFHIPILSGLSTPTSDLESRQLQPQSTFKASLYPPTNKTFPLDSKGNVRDLNLVPVATNAFSAPPDKDGKSLMPFDTKQMSIETDAYGRPLGLDGKRMGRKEASSVEEFRNPIGPNGKSLTRDSGERLLGFDGKSLSRETNEQFVASRTNSGDDPNKLRITSIERRTGTGSTENPHMGEFVAVWGMYHHNVGRRNLGGASSEELSKYGFRNWPPSKQEVNDLVQDSVEKKDYLNLLRWWKSITSEYQEQRKFSKLA